MTRVKRQHFVSRAYLERFAVGGNVLVRRRDGAVFVANPVNVAVEAGMYDMPTRSGGRSTAVEDVLSIVDEAAIDALRELDGTLAPPIVGSATRFNLAVFLALQITRTPESRERAGFPALVDAFLAGRALTRDLVAEFLEREYLRVRPAKAEVEGAYVMVEAALQDPDLLTPGATMNLMLGSVPHIIPVIDSMNWSIEFDRKGRLITSDSPVVIWRTPSERDSYEGVGVGNADEVRFPLDPTKQLVLSHRSAATTRRMGGDRVRACNADVAASCHNFMVGRPDQRTSVESLRLAEYRPVMRFNVGPGFRREPDGSHSRMAGDIVHFWIPRTDSTATPPRKVSGSAKRSRRAAAKPSGRG